jgi:Icc-related predicted phosphoesterase
MDIIHISDLHGYLPTNLPSGDVLVISGDLSPLNIQGNLSKMNTWVTNTFKPWLEQLPYREKIVIAGNHDFFLQENKWQRALSEFCTYLHNSSVEIDGVKFFGSPCVPHLKGWAFAKSEDDLKSVWRKIPDDTDIFITHTPPHGACDWLPTNTAKFAFGQQKWINPEEGRVHVGSPSLRERILEVRPRYVFCGHIHEAYGVDKIEETWVYNGSIKNEHYHAINRPWHLVTSFNR